MKTYLLAAALLLAGCANHPLDCATGLIAWDDCLPGTKGYAIRQESLKNLAAAEGNQANDDDLQCQSYGAKPGTDAYVNCRVQLKQISNGQQSQQEAQRQRAVQAILLNQKNQQQTPYVMPSQTNCTSTVYGQTVNTTCH